MPEDPAREEDLPLSSGTIHFRTFGADDGPLVVCIHGLSANHHGFDRLSPALARAGHRVVAPDLRGRGRSPATRPGSYGLAAHAGDLAELADRLGAARFDVVGWSLGALIGMQLAASEPSRIRRLVMIDHANREDDVAVKLIERGLARLDRTFASPDDYLEAMRAVGVAEPWSDLWETFYRYELSPAEGGFRPVTSRAAALEDLAYLDLHDLSRELWPRLRVPVLLIRATVPIGGGLIVPAAERDAFAAAVPSLTVVEVDANHYGVVADRRSIAAICDFLAVEPQ